MATHYEGPDEAARQRAIAQRLSDAPRTVTPDDAASGLVEQVRATTMPNAEGRMEVTQEQIDDAEYAVRQSMTADDRQTPRELDDGLLGLRTILDALAARTREVEAMRKAYDAACVYIDASVCDNDTTIEMCQAWQVFVAARRALAAQEGTNGH